MAVSYQSLKNLNTNIKIVPTDIYFDEFDYMKTDILYNAFHRFKKTSDLHFYTTPKYARKLEFLIDGKENYDDMLKTLLIHTNFEYATKLNTDVTKISKIRELLNKEQFDIEILAKFME